MKKKLLAAAVVTAFAAPAAFAQTAPTNVTIYGNFQMEIMNIKAEDASAGAPNNNVPSRMRIGSPGVFNIGFRGTERLGGGLAVIWQVEQNAAGDGTGTSNTWGSRNTFLGLQSGMGQLFFGNFDSPLKQVLGINNFAFGLTNTGGINPFLNNGDTSSNAPNSNSTSPDVAFSRRNNNSLNYASPMFSGFQVRGQYAANESKSTTAGPGFQNNPYLYGASATWTGGPFRAGVGYQKHVGFRMIALTGQELDDSSWLVSGSWTSGPFLATAAYSRLNYGSAAGDITRNNWLLSGQYSLGQHRFRAQYQEALDVGGPNTFTAANLGVQVNGVAVTTLGGIRATGGETGANQWNLGYGYALSKRTEAYAFYSVLNNDNNARVNYAGGSAIIGANGQKATAFGLGMLHRF